MSLLFLLKKKSEGDISFAEIGVRSSINMTSTFGFPLLDCKGVNDIMGISISVDGCCYVVLVAGLPGVDSYVSCPLFYQSFKLNFFLIT
jgi:hypothetical protein